VATGNRYGHLVVHLKAVLKLSLKRPVVALVNEEEHVHRHQELDLETWISPHEKGDHAEDDETSAEDRVVHHRSLGARLNSRVGTGPPLVELFLI